MSEEKKVSIPFTENEANAALQLFDLAVKAQGLAVSEAATILTGKLRGAFAQTIAVPDEVEKEDIE